MWFEGSVAQAITASRQEGKPLLVLLTGVCLATRSAHLHIIVVPCRRRTARKPYKQIISLCPPPAGFDQGSRAVQDALMEQAGEEQVEGCISLCLEVGARA